MNDKAKPEVFTDERCFITELVNEAAWPEFSLARCRVEPGVTTQRHSLSVHEFYVIEDGSGRMHLGESDGFEVGPGDVVTIPKDCAQRITNTGTTDLLFLCVCAPRFWQECYTSLE